MRAAGMVGAFGALLLAATAASEPAEFARGRVISVPEGSVGARFGLPQDVYEWATRADLGDVRLLDGTGEEVAYTIRRPETREEPSDWKDAAFFGLPDGDVGSGADSRVEVDVDAGGTVIAIRGQPAAARPFVGFLVDAGPAGEPATDLRLEWSPGSGDFVGRVSIEASDDLDEWRQVVQRAAIARLTGPGQSGTAEPGQDDAQILLDRLELPAVRQRYLKITQVEGNGSLELTRVQLRHRRSELPDRQWKDLDGRAVDDGFEFSTGGSFPVDRVTLVQGDSSQRYLLAARLFSRSDPGVPWRSRGRRAFYQAVVSGVAVTSEPLKISTGDRHWRVEPDGELVADLRLRIGWLPDEFVFLQQGPSPYLLVYGQAGLHGRQWPLTDLLARLGDGKRARLADVPLATVGEPQVLGGPDRLVAVRETDWRTLLLWAVLLLGVAVVGTLAYRLLRSQITSDPEG
jgi:hypothetical protein